MPSKSFSYSSVLGFGWRVMTANFWFFVGVGGIILLVSALGQIPKSIMRYCPGAVPPFLFFLMLGVSFVVETILGIGFIKITLSFCDGQKPRFSTLFNGMDCFWRYIGTGLLCALIYIGISIACILPFVFLFGMMRNAFLSLSVVFAVLVLVIHLLIRFSLCFYFVVDKGLGPVSALKASSLATAGVKWSLFFFGILCFLIYILGLLCFFVGILAALPIIMTAMALVYRLLLEQTPELAKLGTGSNQLESAVRPRQTVQLGQGVHFNPGVQPGQLRRATTMVQSGEQGKDKGDKSFIFWLIILIILSVAMAWGVVCRLWPSSSSETKSEQGISPNSAAVSPSGGAVVPPSGGVAVSPPSEAAVSSTEVSLTGILYSEDKPLVVIDGEIVKEGGTINGVKVVKIHKDSVELERAGVKWTQRVR
ncbi:MAG: hypothetical protein PHY02_09430 [Phycisphaerae bacterium]|nr:hypothetical protein [Phycisphaerae bacterium]